VLTESSKYEGGSLPLDCPEQFMVVEICTLSIISKSRIPEI